MQTYVRDVVGNNKLFETEVAYDSDKFETKSHVFDMPELRNLTVEQNLCR